MLVGDERTGLNDANRDTLKRRGNGTIHRAARPLDVDLDHRLAISIAAYPGSDHARNGEQLWPVPGLDLARPLEASWQILILAWRSIAAGRPATTTAAGAVAGLV